MVHLCDESKYMKIHPEMDYKQCRNLLIWDKKDEQDEEDEQDEQDEQDISSSRRLFFFLVRRKD